MKPNISMTTQQKIEKLKSYIKYWEVQPEGNWCEDKINSGHRRCAFGHVFEIEFGGKSEFIHEWKESSCYRFFKSIGGHEIVKANNNEHNAYNQPTPKQRTLAWAYNKLRELERELPIQAKVLTNLPKVTDKDQGTKEDVQQFEKILS